METVETPVDGTGKAKRGEVLSMIPAPRMKRREAWLDLPSEYDGFRVKVWLNPPARLWRAIQDVAVDRAAGEAALQEIVLEHNGWMDTYGISFPAAHTTEFWEEIPDELAAVVLIVCQLEMGKLPQSLVPKNRR